MVPTITIKEDLCIKCGMCIQDCPCGLYNQETEGSVPEVHNLAICISCGHCSAICPPGAIIHSGFPQDYLHQINEKNQPSNEEVLELIRARRSIRVFRDKPVERQQIERIIDAARLAPTGHNMQATQNIVIENKKILNEMAQATTNQMSWTVNMVRNPLIKPLVVMIAGKQYDSIVESVPFMEKMIADFKSGKDNVLFNAPVVIIFHADEKTIFGDISVQLAVQNATLMTHSLGLGGFYSGLVLMACQRDKTLKQMIGLPRNHKAYGCLVIGYPKYEFKKWIERNKPEVSWL